MAVIADFDQIMIRLFDHAEVMGLIHTELNQHQRFCIDNPQHVQRFAEVLQSVARVIIGCHIRVDGIIA
ncbi:hypothetical protein D3C74_489640 [compost metagenome]